MQSKKKKEILNEEDFKTFMVDRMDSVAEALREVANGMKEFKADYFENIQMNIKDLHEHEEHLKWRIAKVEMSHKMFKAQVFGGITAVIGIVEIARRLFEN